MNNLSNKNKYIEFLKTENGIILIFVFLKFLIHFYTNLFEGYGIFRDELYYLSCASRPALGYVDQPPLSIWFLTFYSSIFGKSVFAIRMVPAILGALTVWFSGKITKEMGGGRSALFISLSAVLLGPIYLAMNSYYSMNSFDILLWAVTFYFLTKLIADHSNQLWIILGITLGFGLLNKISFLWMGFGIAHSFMILTRGKIFLKKGIWLAGITSIFLFFPFIIWNLTHDMAHFEFIKNAQQFKYSGITRMGFVKELLMILNPVSIAVWLPGLFWFFFGEKKKFRVIGLISLTVFLLLLINGKSKAEYLSGAFIPLFCAGGIFFQNILRPVIRRLLSYGITTSVLISGIILAPLALPVLPVDIFINYSRALGISRSSAEGKSLDSLPQFYADMHGWETMAENISRVFLTIPQSERDAVVFWGSNYGRAGAIEYFSDKYPLPRTVSPHNNFWLWGYGNGEIKHVIIIGGEEEVHKKSFNTVKPGIIHKAKHAIPYENNLTIYLCSDPKVKIEDVWERLKQFI